MRTVAHLEGALERGVELSTPASEGLAFAGPLCLPRLPVDDCVTACNLKSRPSFSS